MEQEFPAEIVTTGLQEWYSGLNDPTRVKVRRYLRDIDTSSSRALLKQLMSRSFDDSNYRLSIVAGTYLRTMDMDDYDRFMVNEAYIDGLYGAEEYESAKAVCCESLDIFPSIRERFLDANGGSLPKTIVCRNRLIDILVGVESNYDEAYGILDEYVNIGILDPEELDYRKQSLKIHRLQKSFDNLFIYRPKE